MSKRKNRKNISESVLESPTEGFQDSDNESSGSAIMSRTSSRLSQMSVTSSQGALDGEEVSLQDQFSACVEELQDKRATSRVQATQKLLKLLSSKYLMGQVSHSDVRGIISMSRKLIASNGPESINFCKVCSAIWITWGPDTDNYSSIVKSLSYVIKNGSSPSLQAAAVNSLSLISVLEGSDHCEELLKSLAKLFVQSQDEKKISNEMIVAALAGYGLIFGHCQPVLDSEEFNDVVENHIQMLDSSSLDIRVGAGENLALLIEVLHEREIDPLEYIHSYNELLSKLKTLSNESSKHISKVDKSMQKTSIREYVSYIQDRISPSIDLKFKLDVVTFENWKEIRLLNAFRECIGEGLHSHFYLNPLFQELFNWSGGDAEERENLRLFDTTIGKQRAKNLREQRKQKSSRIS